MEHLSEEQLVEHYYHDGDAEVAVAHLRSCPDCTAQYQTLERVLGLVNDAPVPDRGEDYGAEVWNRLRWKLGASKRRQWKAPLAVAAMLAVAFFIGQFWQGRNGERSGTITDTQTAQKELSSQTVPTATNDKAVDRLLFVVVGDHLDNSERMLLEVVNAGSAVGAQEERAGELVAANRIYRQTALQRGDDRIAELLSDLEPILVELANAGSTLEGKKLAGLQQRIDSKALLFKVRVVSAQTTKQVNSL